MGPIMGTLPCIYLKILTSKNNAKAIEGVSHTKDTQKGKKVKGLNAG
jgi:hypothetical protein